MEERCLLKKKRDRSEFEVGIGGGGGDGRSLKRRVGDGVDGGVEGVGERDRERERERGAREGDDRERERDETEVWPRLRPVHDFEDRSGSEGASGSGSGSEGGDAGNAMEVDALPMPIPMPSTLPAPVNRENGHGHGRGRVGSQSSGAEEREEGECDDFPVSLARERARKREREADEGTQSSPKNPTTIAPLRVGVTSWPLVVNLASSPTVPSPGSCMSISPVTAIATTPDAGKSASTFMSASANPGTATGANPNIVVPRAPLKNTSTNTNVKVRAPVRNKLGINHMDILYETRQDKMVCRMCRWVFLVLFLSGC